MLPTVAALWRRTRIAVAPERYVLASLPPERAAAAAALVVDGGAFAALVREREEVSLTVAEAVWQASGLTATALAGPYRAITLDLELDLGVVGYLAPAAAALAAAGVSIVPQCAYKRDHLLVREADLAQALAVLEELIAG
jgi:hypothetical protein